MLTPSSGRDGEIDEKMDKDVKELLKESVDTMLNIAQMTRFRMRYLQNWDSMD